MAENEKKASVFWLRVLKWAILGVAAILILAIAAAAVCYLKYRSVEQKNLPAETVAEIRYTLEDGTATLGDFFQAETTVRLPWNKSVGEIGVELKDGVQQAGQPSVIRLKTEYGSFLWKITLPLQTYRTFEKVESPGSVTVKIGSKGGTEAVNFTLPALSSEFMPQRVSTEPEPAPKLSELPQKMDLGQWIAYGIVALLVIVLVIGEIWHLRHKNDKGESPKTVLQITLEKLQALRGDFAQGKIPVKVAISQLTLILRAFFEQHFQMPAERQTTGEFLQRIRYEKNLTAEQQYFLEDFLRAADMVKYANMPSDEASFKVAADNVENLVKSASGAQGAR